MARTGRYKEEAPHKAGAGANRPPCVALNYPDARHHNFCYFFPDQPRRLNKYIFKTLGRLLEIKSPPPHLTR
jgi:hypothetical protein